MAVWIAMAEIENNGGHLHISFVVLGLGWDHWDARSCLVVGFGDTLPCLFVCRFCLMFSKSNVLSNELTVDSARLAYFSSRILLYV